MSAVTVATTRARILHGAALSFLDVPVPVRFLTTVPHSRDRDHDRLRSESPVPNACTRGQGEAQLCRVGLARRSEEHGQ
jgi:hypothetical protein